MNKGQTYDNDPLKFSRDGLAKNSSLDIINSDVTAAYIKEPEPIAVVSEDSALANIKVLVAEDIALNQLLIKLILSDFGFEFDIAGTGKIAIEKLQQNRYDIVLMDLQMPEMNGFEATDYIRNVMKSNIPIIALTADVTTVDVEKCKAVGMNDYISKPIEEKLLFSKMAKFLKKE